MSQGPNFLVAFREASWNFPRQDRDFKEFRGFPGMELGIFRVAKSSGEGRALVRVAPGIHIPCLIKKNVVQHILLFALPSLRAML